VPNHHHLVLGQADGFRRAFELMTTAMRPRFELPADMPVGAGPEVPANPQQVQAMRDFGLLIVPSIVCLAFAVELILKTLLVQEGVLPDPTMPRPPRAPRGIHELDALFAALPGVHADRIRAEVGGANFDARLAEHAKTFTQWRYSFELQGVGADEDFLAAVFRAAREGVVLG